MGKDRIVGEFKMRPFGSKGWMRGELFCPECDRNDKFAVLFSEGGGGVAHCFYCQAAWPLFKILKGIGREDLNEAGAEFKGIKELPPLSGATPEEEEKKATLPLGFKRTKCDEYLEDRSFEPWQYEQYGVGVADLDPRTTPKPSVPCRVSPLAKRRSGRSPARTNASVWAR